MVKAQTTREQNDIAKQTGQGLFAFACKSGGTVSCDGPIAHEIAKPLIRLMAERTAAEVWEAFEQQQESHYRKSDDTR